MDEMKKALKAYNTIRKYCKKRDNCENCLFSNDYGYCNISAHNSVPVDWQELDNTTAPEENKMSLTEVNMVISLRNACYSLGLKEYVTVLDKVVSFFTSAGK